MNDDKAPLPAPIPAPLSDFLRKSDHSSALPVFDPLKAGENAEKFRPKDTTRLVRADCQAHLLSGALK